LVDRLNLKPGLWAELERHMLRNDPATHEKWKTVFFGKSEYYENLKVKITSICKELKLESKFCFQ
jgi:hypothetical protein